MSNRALRRADAILEMVARTSVPLSLTEIADAVAIPVSSAHDLLDELVDLGHLRERDRRYTMGFRSHVLSVTGDITPPAGVGRARLRRLSQECGAPLTLAALVGHAVHYLDHAGPRAPRRLQSVADDHRPRAVLRTAAGRLLLAMSDSATRDRILGSLQSTDPQGVSGFIAELPEIRRAGLARSDGLADPDIAAIALPTADPAVAILLTARRAPRGGRVRHLEVSARRLRVLLSDR